jgi:hypothetical protein
MIRSFWVIGCRVGFVGSIVLWGIACKNAATPLDADERHLVDSLGAAGISMQRYLIDSTCKVQRTTVLPLLVDSIRAVREREIREQIQSINNNQLSK